MLISCAVSAMGTAWGKAGNLFPRHWSGFHSFSEHLSVTCAAGRSDVGRNAEHRTKHPVIVLDSGPSSKEKTHGWGRRLSCLCGRKADSSRAEAHSESQKERTCTAQLKQFQRWCSRKLAR